MANLVCFAIWLAQKAQNIAFAASLRLQLQNTSGLIIHILRNYLIFLTKLNIFKSVEPDE